MYQPFQPTLTEPALKGFGLRLQQAAPCPALNSTVHSFLQVTATGPTFYPVLPDGTQALFLSPHATLLGGAYTQARDIPLPQAGEYFGVQFRPGALRHFLDLDVFELMGQLADVNDLSLASLTSLNEILYQQSSFAQRQAVCERLLLQLYRPQVCPPLEQALQLVYQTLGNLSVAQLAAATHRSGRHMNRLFRVHTGLRVKEFAQTVRLQHACHRLFLAPSDSLATAHDLGFTDQAHLLNSFRQRFGAPPRRFFRQFMSDSYNS